MKHTLASTFGGVEFDAIVTVEDSKVAEYAAKHALYHYGNSKVQKAMKTRKVVFSSDVAKKLTEAYRSAGVEISNVRAYVPAPPAEASRKRATAIYDGLKANGPTALAKGLGKLGIDSKLPETEAIEAIHKALSGDGLLALLKK